MTKLTVSESAGNYFYSLGLTIVAVHFTQDTSLVIKCTVAELGIYKAVPLPYSHLGDWGTWKLVVNSTQENGFAKAELLDRCKACVFATGNKYLPCTVNPMSYGTPCRDYEI